MEVTVVTAVVFSNTARAAVAPPPSLVITGASLTAVTVIATELPTTIALSEAMVAISPAVNTRL